LRTHRRAIPSTRGAIVAANNTVYRSVGHRHPRGMADLLRTSARSVVPLSPDTQPADVAALAEAGLTAYHAVKQAAPLLPPGSTCVVGAGGLGRIGGQCFRALTATAIVVLDVNEVALQLALNGGADQTVLVEGSHVDKVLDITDGRGAEVVLDFVGERGAQRDAWQMTRRAGSHFVIGYGGRSKLRRLT
jgi:NAD+-dependent secondary alcohol dehydrogenase Adh1